MVNAKLHTIKLPYPDKGDRNVWVYVPSHSYGEKLPVVYMTDGQNLFDDNSTPHGSWGFDKYLKPMRHVRQIVKEFRLYTISNLLSHPD